MKLPLFFNTFSHQPIIDPKVVEYVVAIMKEKNAQLNHEAFTTVYIMKLGEIFINVPNACAVKNHTAYQYLFLTSTTLDILEHLVFDEHTQTYTLTMIAQYSPYTMKVVLPKQRGERMMRALIEHELGHLFNEHHCRKYAPTLLLQVAILKMVVGFALYEKFIAHSVLSVGEWLALDWPCALLGAIIVYGVSYIIPALRNSSFISSDKWEEEADEFITSDKEILTGAILFQEISLKAQTYIYSYTNNWIRLHAWWKRLDCAEFVKRYRKSAHKYFERSAVYGDAYHPLQEDRIARFQKRMEELPTSEQPSVEFDPAVITIYSGTQVVKKFNI